MHKGLGIALMLACLPVQMVMVSEPVSAQTASDRKAMAERLVNQGNQLYGANKYQEAFQTWEQALQIYREIQDLNAQGLLLSNLGIAYGSVGQTQKSLDYYQQALTIFKQSGVIAGEGLTLGNIGTAYNLLGQYQKASEAFQQSLAIAKQMGDRNAEGRAIANLGNTYNYLGQYQKAIDAFQQGLTIFQQLGDRAAEGSALGNLGGAYNFLGQYQKAIDYHQKALAIQKQISDRNGEGNTLGNLGNSYNYLGQYQKALGYHQQALALKKQIGDLNGEGIVLTNLGISSYYLGQYQKAIEYYQQSYAIKKQTGDLNGESRALGNLALAYDALGQYQKSIEIQQQSLAIKKQIGDRNGEANSLTNLGNTHASLKQYQKAIEYHQQALVIYKQISDLSGEGRTLGSLGFSYKALGQYQKAIEYHQQSIAISKQIGDRLAEGRALSDIGIAYDAIGQSQKAVEYHQQSIAISKQIGDRFGEGVSLYNLASLFTQQKQPKLAIVFYKQSVNVRESIRKDIIGLGKEEQQSYLDTVADTYRKLADLLLKQGRVMEALQVLDLLKVQELEDYLKNIKGSDRTAQGVRLLEAERAISNQLATISLEKGAAINSQIVNQIKQLPPSEINKVPDYLKQIPQGTVLLYPLILGDRLEIILFSPNTLPISRTVNISKEKLEALVTEFRSGLIDAGFEDYKEPAVALYNALIKPIEAELIQAKAKTILYAPDGILRYIPLAALNDGKQWLSEKYRISNLIAYTLSDFSPRPKFQPKILAGAFGGKADERKFGQQGLPATLKEVLAIANAFPNSSTLLGDNFSRQGTEAKFKNYNILHFATHAEFNTGTPDNSFIIFGNGDKIRLSELTDWQIPNVELIVLSACQTGVGKLGTGVEILGFGYQVQKIGAKNAIASLWNVDDVGTQALMEAFYKELQKGDVSPTDALHRAQVTLIKSDKFNHPFYWSAFFAIGNGL